VAARGNVVLTGGTSPERAYELAAERRPDWLGDERAAELYDRELEGVALDLVLNGIGPDGHIASLYPNEPTLRIRDRRAVAAESKLEPFVDRVTMTLELLNSAPLVVFLVTGTDKAEAVRQAFGAPPSAAIPASLARSTTGRTVVILDPPAAEKLGI
jgi:6-phosphogluconolactonase